MVWNELRVSAYTECDGVKVPIQDLNVYFVLYEAASATFNYFDKKTNENGVAILPSSTAMSLTRTEMAVQTEAERGNGSLVGAERENSRHNTVIVSSNSLTSENNSGNYWFVEAEYNGDGFSSSSSSMSNTSIELIYDMDENGGRAIQDSTTIIAHFTNYTAITKTVSYWLYDSNNTILAKDLDTGTQDIRISNIPTSAVKIMIHAFGKNGNNYVYSINETKTTFTQNTTTTVNISLGGSNTTGYPFTITSVSSVDALFRYIGTNFGVYPVRFYVRNSENSTNIISTGVTAQIPNATITGYCNTQYMKFIASGTNTEIVNNYLQSVSDVNLFGYIGGRINATLLMPKKKYVIETPVVYDSEEFIVGENNLRPVFNLPNTQINIRFLAWNGNALIYNHSVVTTSNSSSITITTNSISSNTINKNWFFQCLAGKGGGSDGNLVKFNLSKPHYDDLTVPFIVSSYSLTDQSNPYSHTSSTVNHLYCCKYDIVGNSVVPKENPMFTFTLRREQNVVFRREDLIDYVRGFGYEYGGGRESQDISLINELNGTNYTYERDRASTSRLNFTGFSLTPTAKTPPSKTEFYSEAADALQGGSAGVSNLNDFKEDFINQLNSGSAFYTIYAIDNYESEYANNSKHCYVMDRTIYPAVEESSDNYFFICNYCHNAASTTGVCKTVRVQLERVNNPYSVNLQYSMNGIDNWKNYTIGSWITLPQYSMVYFRSTTTIQNFSKDASNYYRFVIDNNYKESNSTITYADLFGDNIYGRAAVEYGYNILVGGCISGLLGLSPSSSRQVSNYCFANLFENCKITNCGLAPIQLKLDLTSIPNYAYYRMFYNTKYLLNGPQILATTVGTGSMKEMFRYSTVERLYDNKLYFTAAATDCCRQMFQNSNFSSNFEIAATTTAPGCFREMFASTTNLSSQTIKLNNIRVFADSSCTAMFYYSSISKFPKFSSSISSVGNNAFKEAFRATKLINIDFTLPYSSSVGIEGCREMFKGLQPDGDGTCSLDGLVLSSNTKSESCYYGMFQNAKRLDGTFRLPTTNISASGCAYMFNNAEGVYCYSLNPTSLSNYCYSHMFDTCTFRTIGWNIYPAPELPATTLKEECYSYMFKSSNITQHHNMYVPKAESLYIPTKYVLKATNLPKKCYYAMYQDSNLKYVSSIITTALTTAGESSCGHMFQNTPIFIDNRARMVVRNDGVELTFRKINNEQFADTYKEKISSYTKNGTDNLTHVGQDCFIKNNVLFSNDDSSPSRFVPSGQSLLNILTSFTVTVGNDITLFNGQSSIIYTGGTSTTNQTLIMPKSTNDYDYAFIDTNSRYLKSELNITNSAYKYTVQIGDLTYTANGQTSGEVMTDINRVYYIRLVDYKKLISIENKGYLLVRLTDIAYTNINLGGSANLASYQGYHPFIWFHVVTAGDKLFKKEKREFKTTKYAEFSYQENTSGFELPSWSKNSLIYEPGYDSYSVTDNFSLSYSANPEYVKLNATSLGERCYEYMFSGCPNLYFGHNFTFGNLKTLSTGCFSHMFDTCKNLRTITPNLKDFTSMGSYSCEYMYARCCNDDYEFLYIPNDFWDWLDVVMFYFTVAFLVAWTCIALAQILPLADWATYFYHLFNKPGGPLPVVEVEFSLNFKQILAILSPIGAGGAGYGVGSSIALFGGNGRIFHDEIISYLNIGINRICNPNEIYTHYSMVQSELNRTHSSLEKLTYTENGLGLTLSGVPMNYNKETTVCQYENSIFSSETKTVYNHENYTTIEYEDYNYFYENPVWGDFGLYVKSYNDRSQYVFTNSLNEGCYKGMFEEVFSLIDPKIRFSTSSSLPVSCYESTFNRCISLITGITIPTNAVSVSTNSMKSMFRACPLFNGPINSSHSLNATQLSESCYESMFYMCRSMSAAPFLPASTFNTTMQNCYKNMFAYASDITVSFYVDVTIKKDGLANDYNFTFMLLGDAYCVSLRYAMDNTKWSSDDFGWLVVDNMGSTTEINEFKNLTFGSGSNQIQAKNKTFAAPDTLYFLNTANSTVATEFKNKISSLINKSHVYFYDPQGKQNTYWHDFGTANGYRFEFETYGAAERLEKLIGFTSATTFTGAHDCTQLSYIKSNISASDLITNFYTISWVDGLAPSGIVIDTKVQGQYHGPAYGVSHGKNTIPVGWLTYSS